MSNPFEALLQVNRCIDSVQRSSQEKIDFFEQDAVIILFLLTTTLHQTIHAETGRISEGITLAAQTILGLPELLPESISHDGHQLLSEIVSEFIGTTHADDRQTPVIAYSVSTHHITLSCGEEDQSRHFSIFAEVGRKEFEFTISDSLVRREKFGQRTDLEQQFDRLTTMDKILVIGAIFQSALNQLQQAPQGQALS